MKLLRKILLLTVFSTVFTMSINSASNEVKSGELWGTVAYLAAEQGQSNEMTAAFGLAGVAQGAIWGSIGGPIGIGLGVFAGL